MKEKFTLKKNERLKSRKRIEQLFREGEHFFLHPFKVHFSFSPFKNDRRGSILQTGIGVNTRHFKKAVDRNRIKRVTRESYRLQKNILIAFLQQRDLSLDLFLVYVAKEMPDYWMLNEKLRLILGKLEQQINENYTKYS